MNILENENSEDLGQRLTNLASEKVLQNNDIFENKTSFKDQDHAQSTYAKLKRRRKNKLERN